MMLMLNSQSVVASSIKTFNWVGYIPWNNVFCIGNSFSKFHPKKYYFDLYKEFFMENWPKFTRFRGGGGGGLIGNFQ